jgi:hypothetical protein
MTKNSGKTAGSVKQDSKTYIVPGGRAAPAMKPTVEGSVPTQHLVPATPPPTKK